MPLRAIGVIFTDRKHFCSESIWSILVEQKLPLFNFQSYGAGASVMYPADV